MDYDDDLEDLFNLAMEEIQSHPPSQSRQELILINVTTRRADDCQKQILGESQDDASHLPRQR